MLVCKSLQDVPPNLAALLPASWEWRWFQISSELWKTPRQLFSSPPQHQDARARPDGGFTGKIENMMESAQILPLSLPVPATLNIHSS